uniref:Elongation of very long chain fatty acids protein n=1 Tax=Lutzomyia longipalpis TaxID=7200 RepID=A0A1B0CDB3_LUTLO
MRSPFPVIGIVLVYLYFVLKLGPYLMESRKPYNMQKLLVFYNFYQAFNVENSILEIFKYLKYLSGPQFLLIGFLNSFVHIVMYFYYMLSAMGPKYQRFLWWKKYLTTLQLAQFCVMLFYLTIIAIMDSKLPRSHTFFFITNVVIFLYLFGDFYRKEYNKKHYKDSSATNKYNNSNSIAQLSQLKRND